MNRNEWLNYPVNLVRVYSWYTDIDNVCVKEFSGEHAFNLATEYKNGLYRQTGRVLCTIEANYLACNEHVNEIVIDMGLETEFGDDQDDEYTG